MRHVGHLPRIRTNNGTNMYQNQSKGVMNLSLPHYGTNKCERTKISNNKPDVTIRDNKQETFMSINVAIPGDRNVVRKEAEKILKHKDLIIEIQGMWNM